jgi:phytoene desaturase
MKKNIKIIGSGFSSLAASCYLAKQGHEVTILEKNASVGGRARQMKRDGFTFDLGPSWYWMPDVFEKFFGDFDKKPSDYYNLVKLAPAYTVFFGINEFVTISDNLNEIAATFENIEPGSGLKLKKFIKSAQENYEIAINDVVYRPGESPLELVTFETAKKVDQFFSTISKDVSKQFKNPKLIQILEFPVLFLGAKPSNTPSFYNFMNFADFGLGTWQPSNGFHDVIAGMETLARSLGVQINTNATIDKIEVVNNTVSGLVCNGIFQKADIVLSGADYHHTETLLDQKYRQYSEKYWNSRTFAPSSLLFYIGFNKKLKNVTHHNLFFDTDFNLHASEIYEDAKWPTEPLFYANFTSLTNPKTAPDGCENGFFLIPIAPGIEDTPALREKYLKKIIDRFEKITGQEIEKSIIFSESFCKNDFIEQYNSYKGNAYGLANTLLQTAFLRPKLRSKKVKNLYFTGQLTVPGPGVPPALISGKVVAYLIQKHNKL